MKKNFFGLVLLSLTIAGCSVRAWIGQMYMVRAEEAYAKAYALRVQRNVPYEKRLKLYRAACNHFVKAYRHDTGIFTLSRIESAAEACMRVKDEENETEFRAFAEKYIKEHPTEVEYGDAFPAMSFE